MAVKYDPILGKLREADTGGSGTGIVETIVAGSNISVDDTDPANPIVSVETLTLADISDVTASTAEVNILDGVIASTTELNYVDGVTSAIQGQIDGKQPLDSDLTTIAGLTATSDNFMQAKAGAWASRTVAQVKTDLSLSGTNSGDQTSIVGITGTKAQFDTAVTDGNILYVGDVTQYTDEMAQDAVGSIMTSGARISFNYDDATPAITADINAAPGSIVTSDAAGLRLDGDDASPGNDYYYGTDGSGTKGFYVLPTGGGGVSLGKIQALVIGNVNL